MRDMMVGLEEGSVVGTGVFLYVGANEEGAALGVFNVGETVSDEEVGVLVAPSCIGDEDVGKFGAPSTVGFAVAGDNEGL